VTIPGDRTYRREMKPLALETAHTGGGAALTGSLAHPACDHSSLHSGEKDLGGISSRTFGEWPVQSAVAENHVQSATGRQHSRRRASLIATPDGDSSLEESAHVLGAFVEAEPIVEAAGAAAGDGELGDTTALALGLDRPDELRADVESASRGIHHEFL
jgi:hypothetical protein